MLCFQLYLFMKTKEVFSFIVALLLMVFKKSFQFFYIGSSRGTSMGDLLKVCSVLHLWNFAHPLLLGCHVLQVSKVQFSVRILYNRFHYHTKISLQCNFNLFYSLAAIHECVVGSYFENTCHKHVLF